VKRRWEALLTPRKVNGTARLRPSQFDLLFGLDGEIEIFCGFDLDEVEADSPSSPSACVRLVPDSWE
jgi:hypothetical protein